MAGGCPWAYQWGLVPQQAGDCLRQPRKLSEGTPVFPLGPLFQNSVGIHSKSLENFVC